MLLAKEQYHKYIPFVDLNHMKDTAKELYHVYQALIEAQGHTSEDLDLRTLETYFFHKFPDADKQLYSAVFEDLAEDIDIGLARKMLDDMKSQQLAMAASEAAFKYSTGNGKLEDAVAAFDKLTAGTEHDRPEFEFVTTKLSQILLETVQGHGLRWRLNFLNKSLGSLRRGNFGFIFARPETGKTTFLASEITAMLKELPDDAGPIIWLNNEQPGNEVMLRVYQAYFGITLEALVANTKKFEDQFEREVHGRFLMVDDANISKSFVERLLKQTKPSLVIYDQIDKIKGFAADREDLRLGAIYIWARELAKTYAPSIGVCQADGSAENQKWLTMDMVANAKTAKQAEADWILGLGTVHAEGAQYIRYLNISKNKLLGDSDTLSHLRHGRSEVLIEPQIARFKDIAKY